MASDPVPFDETLMPAEQPASLAQIELTERHLAYAQQRWPDASEKMQQYRMRQAIWVRFEHAKPHPEDPNRKKLGGPQPNSGRRVQKRIGEALVEAAQMRQKEIVDAAFAPLEPGNDAMTRHKAAMNLARHEREERAMDIVEDEYARKTQEDITREAAEVFAQMIRDGELSLEDIEGTATEIVDEPKQLSA